MKKFLLLFGLFLTTLTMFAQEAPAKKNITMANALRENGGIFIVIGVIIIILIGLLFYLFIIDKKVSKLEKELKK